MREKGGDNTNISSESIKQSKREKRGWKRRLHFYELKEYLNIFSSSSSK